MEVKLELVFKRRIEDFVEYYLDMAEKEPENSDKYLTRANELINEPDPSVSEIYDFLSSPTYNDLNEPLRYISLVNIMANDLNLNLENVKLIIENNKVILYFITNTEKSESYFKDFPLDDTIYEGSVGNELLFPSRKDVSDLLGEIGFL